MQLFRGNIYKHTNDIGHLITGHPDGFLLSYNWKTFGKKEWQPTTIVDDDVPANVTCAFSYFDVFSQQVPFYQWELKQGTVPSIFGSEQNNWKTNYSSDLSTSGIFGYNYQSLDRRTIAPNNKYFIGSNTQISDIYERAYIFNVDGNGNYSYGGPTAGNYPSNFLVSAPFHFYFGLIKGDSALDKFKTKYSILE